MRPMAFGIVAGGAVAAAFFGAATANANTDWTPVYDGGSADLSDARLVQAPGSTALTWEVPNTTFTHTIAPTQILNGTDYVTPSSGGFNDEFVGTGANAGAIYDQDQLGGGFTNLYYDASATGTPVDVLKTPFGDLNISWAASLFTPADASKFLTSTDALGNAGLYSALDLGLKTAPTTASPEHWAPVYGTTHEVAASATSAPVWEQTATFTGTGADSTTLTGNDYLAPSFGGYNNEFVTTAGAIYDQDQLGLGFTNLYVDPDPGAAGDHITDVMKTPFGNFDISFLAGLFTPVDYSHAVDVTPVTDLTNAGLYSALDLGLPAATAAVDPLAFLGL